MKLRIGPGGASRKVCGPVLATQGNDDRRLEPEAEQVVREFSRHIVSLMKTG
jgi:hypothetical protein